MKTYKGKKIVLKVEDSDDPSEIYCTTYQMRNFYKQMADGFFSSLDVMNYIQHHKVVTMMNKNDVVLDVCCGRGLLLPMIRWYKSDIKEYVGVDIHEPNISEQRRVSGTKKIDGLEYYPFKVTHKIGSVEEMSTFLDKDSFDLVVYTSAIEHMQKEAGAQSLRECFKVLKSGKQMFISCPNTIKENKYDTQYKAHLYEWDLNELTEELRSIGFIIMKTFGLVAKKRKYDEYIQSLDNSNPLKQLYESYKEYLPREWLTSFFPIITPEHADEVAIIARKPKTSLFR